MQGLKKSAGFCRVNTKIIIIKIIVLYPCARNDENFYYLFLFVLFNFEYKTD